MNIPEGLYAISELDVDKGIDTCGEDGYLDALELVCELLPLRVNELEGFYKEGSWEDYTVKVHALKSNLRMIGASDLGEEAYALENAGHENNTDFIREKTEDFLSRLRDFLERLDKARKCDDGVADKKHITKEQIAEAVTALKEAVSIYDYDAIMNVIEMLDGYDLPEDIKDKISEIKSAHSVIDWIRVDALIKTL